MFRSKQFSAALLGLALSTAAFAEQGATLKLDQVRSMSAGDISSVTAKTLAHISAYCGIKVATDILDWSVRTTVGTEKAIEQQKQTGGEKELDEILATVEKNTPDKGDDIYGNREDQACERATANMKVINQVLAERGSATTDKVMKDAAVNTRKMYEGMIQSLRDAKEKARENFKNRQNVSEDRGYPDDYVSP